MTIMQRSPWTLAAASVVVVAWTTGAVAGQAVVGFKQAPGKVMVTIDGQRVATYVYRDTEIPRPYFANVLGPDGIQITRNQPPVEGRDPTDHPLFHPGIWMAFSDISGSDYWRNQAAVVQEGFTETPTGGRGRGTFAVRNRYLAEQDKETMVCCEVCRYTFVVRPSGYLLIWDSTFFNNQASFYFGDQEEMGLSVRLATPVRVFDGGRILDAAGRINEPEIWGHASNWCDYSGTIDGKYAGAMVMPDPANFRPSWFHARNYGNLLANPFGRKSFGKGEASKVVVSPGDRFRLRFGVLLHVAPAEDKMDLSAAYADYLRLIEELP